MKQLLEKWAELEPEFISIDPGSGEYTFLDGYPVISWREWQSIIQQAIEARGWMWDMKTDYFNSEGKPTYLANIFDDAKWVESKNSPTEALLTAYLSALEAVKTQEVVG